MCISPKSEIFALLIIEPLQHQVLQGLLDTLLHLDTHVKFHNQINDLPFSKSPCNTKRSSNPAEYTSHFLMIS